MPRQRTHHSRRTFAFPQEFPHRLVRFRPVRLQEESGLSRAELTPRPGAHPRTVRRWRNAGARPGTGHIMASPELADKPSPYHPPALRRGWGNARDGMAHGAPSDARSSPPSFLTCAPTPEGLAAPLKRAPTSLSGGTAQRHGKGTRRG